MGWRERGHRQGRSERADENRVQTTTPPKEGHRRKKEPRPSRGLRRAMRQKAKKR